MIGPSILLLHPLDFGGQIDELEKAADFRIQSVSRIFQPLVVFAGHASYTENRAAAFRTDPPNERLLAPYWRLI
jgi:hypothetical protein